MSTGNILTSEADEAGNFGDWHEWDGPQFIGATAAIAMTRQPFPGILALLVVTTSEGRIQVSQAIGEVWGPWTSLL